MYIDYQAIEETKQAAEFLWHLEQVEEARQWKAQVVFLKKFFTTVPWIPVIYTWEFFTATSPGPTDF